MFLQILSTIIIYFIVLEFIFTLLRLIFKRGIKFHLFSIFLDFVLMILMWGFLNLWALLDDMTSLHGVVILLYIFFLFPLVWIKLKEKFFIIKGFNLSFYYYLQEFFIYYLGPLLIFGLIGFIGILLGNF